MDGPASGQDEFRGGAHERHTSCAKHMSVLHGCLDLNAGKYSGKNKTKTQEFWHLRVLAVSQISFRMACKSVDFIAAVA